MPTEPSSEDIEEDKIIKELKIQDKEGSYNEILKFEGNSNLEIKQKQNLIMGNEKNSQNAEIEKASNSNENVEKNDAEDDKSESELKKAAQQDEEKKDLNLMFEGTSKFLNSNLFP